MGICGYGDNADFDLRRMLAFFVLLFYDIRIESVRAICTFSSSALIRLLHYWYILYLPTLAIKIVLIHWSRLELICFYYDF